MSTPELEDEPETVAYQFDMGKEKWRSWTNTIPRQTPIDSRLATLIEQDLRSARREANAETSPKTVSLMATRIRIRAMQGISSIRDDGDLETAQEQLEEIVDIADALEQ